MITSILKLNRRDIQSLRVTDDYSLHRVVYSLFEDIRSDEEKHASVPSGFLFADKGGDINNRVILILSDREPRTPEFGTLESKAVGDAFLEHDHYQFEVLVNPTRRDNASRKLVALRNRADIEPWFITKAPSSWGFKIHPESLEVRVMQTKQFTKKDNKVIQGRALITGVLSVQDRSLFRKSFQQGIGRGRAFGFGMLQIAPIIVSTNN